MASRPDVAALVGQAEQTDPNQSAAREKLYLAALEKAGADRYATAVILSAFGGYLLYSGQGEKGTAYERRAFAAWEGLDEPDEALAKQNALGDYFDCFSQNDLAAAARLKALALFQAGGYESMTGLTLLNLGGDYHALGEDEKALPCEAQAQSIFERIGDTERLTIILMMQGTAAIGAGQYDKALVSLNRALAIIHDDASRHSECLYLIGRAYHLMGQLDKAVDYYKQALQLSQERLDKLGVARCTMSLGLAYFNAHDYARAADLLNSALVISSLLGERRAIADSSVGLGMTHWYQGDYPAAQTDFARALSIGQQSHDQLVTALSQMGLGMTKGRLGKFDDAMPLAQQATAAFEQMDNKTLLAAGYQVLGGVYEGKGQWELADTANQKAMDAVEAATYQLNDPSDVGALLDMLPHPYARAAAVRLAENKPEDALALAERGRGQGLARQAAVAHVNFSQLLSSDDAQALKAREGERSAAQSLLKAAKSLPDPAEASEKAALQKRRDDAQARSEEAERQYGLERDLLLARYPHYKRLQSIQPPSVADLRALAARNPDTLYLEWSLVDDTRTLLFALSQKDGIQAWTLPTGEKKLARLTETWRAAIQAEDGNEPQAAHALYAALFRPLEQAGLLAPGRYARLVVVADGPLLNIPFAALVPSGSGRLIDRYALSSAVSLGVLTWTRPVTRPAKTLLCIADPLGGKAPTAGTQLAERLRGERLGPLPYARAEAKSVTALVPQAISLIGPAAREADVRQQIGQYGLLHFATHGLLDPNSPLRSGLILAPEPAGSQEDGLLDAGEILTLPLTAQMAVLSACRTAEGKSGGGEGLMGLSWAFQAAGCPSVVASAWSVSDQATGKLMAAFYSGLSRGLRRDEALRRAMQSVRSLAGDASPKYWAAFSLSGDAGPLPILSRSQ